MKTLHVMIAVVASLVAGAATAAPAGNSFDGDVKVIGNAGKTMNIVAIGYRIKPKTSMGHIIDHDHDTCIAKSDEIVVAIGLNAKSGRILCLVSEMP